MGFFQDDQEEKPIDPMVKDYLLSKQAEAKSLKQEIDEKQSGLGWAQFAAGIGDAFQGRSPSQSAGQFQQIRKDIADSTAKNRLSDPNSMESQNFRRAIEATTPDFVKLYGDSWNQVTAADKENVFNPLKFKEDRDSRERAAAALAGERKEAREQSALDRKLKYAQMDIDRDIKLKDKATKDKELSVAQAKQLGLYNSGMLAEQQFNDAVSNPEDYDPTEVGQVIDNSSWAPNWMKNNSAIKAQNAQSAWVEAYLRDASGAAIPPDERLAYAKDYFPMPGDPDDVVANKTKLRAQKMDNSRLAAGVEKEPDVEKYAAAHNISYEQAMGIKRQRQSKQAGR